MALPVTLHSDQGSTYATGSYREIINRYGIRQSMSRKGDCWDNAPMESVFHTLKTELVMHCDYQTRDDARVSLFDYMEVFYNRQRRHSSIGYEAPLQFEAIHRVVRCPPFVGKTKRGLICDGRSSTLNSPPRFSIADTAAREPDIALTDIVPTGAEVL